MEQEKSRQASVAGERQGNLSRAQADTRVLQCEVAQQDRQLRELRAELQARTSRVARLEMEERARSKYVAHAQAKG